MAKRHVIRQGECIHSIAANEGLFWRTIWEHNGNTALRKKRPDPAVLLAGDEVFIPDKRRKTVSIATGRSHRFKIKGIPVKLRLVVQHNEQPIGNEDFFLIEEGRVHRGTTDDKGFLEASISPWTKRARLEIKGLVYELEFGAMDPIEEDIGIQARLQNLGLYDGKLDGDIGPKTTDAIAEFQASVGLEPTGELDDTTRDRLQSHYREMQASPSGTSSRTPAPQEAPASAPAPSPVEDDDDPTDETKEFPPFAIEQVHENTD